MGIMRSTLVLSGMYHKQSILILEPFSSVPLSFLTIRDSLSDSALQPSSRNYSNEIRVDRFKFGNMMDFSTSEDEFAGMPNFPWFEDCNEEATGT